MATTRTPDLELQRIEDLAALEHGRWLVFKHSTRCPISSHAHDEFMTWLAVASEDRPKTARCLVVEARPVSNEIAARTKVRHESPQAILLVDGKVVRNASHHHITSAELTKRCSP